MMIRAMPKASIATAIRGALASAELCLKADDRMRLESALEAQMGALAMPVTPGKGVPKETHDLLCMKYETMLELLKHYESKADGQ